MKLCYSPDYVGAAYSFDTTRKSGWIADSLTDRPIDGIELRTPTPLQQRAHRRRRGVAVVGPAPRQA